MPRRLSEIEARCFQVALEIDSQFLEITIPFAMSDQAVDIVEGALTLCQNLLCPSEAKIWVDRHPRAALDDRSFDRLSAAVADLQEVTLCTVIGGRSGTGADALSGNWCL